MDYLFAKFLRIAFERDVEQARGIFYTTQDTLLLTCRGEGSLLVVEEKREADDHIG